MRLSFILVLEKTVRNVGTGGHDWLGQRLIRYVNIANFALSLPLIPSRPKFQYDILFENQSSDKSCARTPCNSGSAHWVVFACSDEAQRGYKARGR